MASKLVFRGVLIQSLSLVLAAWPAAPEESDVLRLAAEPLIRLNQDRVVACGIAFKGRYRDAAITAELVLERGEVQPVFVLTARYDGPEKPFDMALQTSLVSTAALMPRPGPLPDGTLQTKAPIPGLTGSELMQSLAVSGGRLLLGLAGPNPNVLDFEVPGPLPQEVRASYLACAGDLVQP